MWTVMVDPIHPDSYYPNIRMSHFYITSSRRGPSPSVNLIVMCPTQEMRTS